MPATTADRSSVGGRLAAGVRRFPSDHAVGIGLLAGIAAVIVVARIGLGADATDAEVLRFGYGLPAFEAGRPWTVFSGLPLEEGLPLVPQPISVVALFLCERRAGRRSTLVTFFAGHVLAVCIVAAFLWLVGGSGNAWLADMAATVDVGPSNAAFACLGAWTAFLPATSRRRARLGISCYLPWLLLLSGHVYDLSHPMGWLSGLALGSLLRPGPPRRARRPAEHRDVPWLVVVALLGTAYGIWDGWHGGGPGGPFGWGPGASG